ncbi:MAG: thioesterase family protein [Victivallaceae bacterium]|nr:thioesterase family protein [Victivallaceae bacterium]
MMAAHEMTYRVPYADTDQMGVVYYANYLVYFERSRTELLRDAGLPYRELEQRGYFLPVTEAVCKYRAPAVYDQLLTFRSYVLEARGVRLTIASEVWHQDKLLVDGYVVLACVDASKKPARIPPFLADACKRYRK